MAQRTLAEGGTDLANQITYIFRRCLARMPRSEERQRIVELYHAALAHYRQQPAAAREMAGTAEGSADVEQESHNAEVLAAWTVIGNMLLNLDETLTKG